MFSFCPSALISTNGRETAAAVREGAWATPVCVSSKDTLKLSNHTRVTARLVLNAVAMSSRPAPSWLLRKEVVVVVVEEEEGGGYGAKRGTGEFTTGLLPRALNDILW
jgi:hypothetical protein